MSVQDPSAPPARQAFSANWGGRLALIGLAAYTLYAASHLGFSWDRFIVGIDNIRSRKAMLKIGGVLTDRREIRMRNGQPAESVVYEITSPDGLDRPPAAPGAP